MNAQERLWGAGGTQIITGAGAHAVDTGFAAYAAKCRIANTQITSFTHYKDGASAAVTDKSFESVNLIAGIDYISFPYPVTSITLNGATDSLILYLQPHNV